MLETGIEKYETLETFDESDGCEVDWPYDMTYNRSHDRLHDHWSLTNLMTDPMANPMTDPMRDPQTSLKTNWQHGWLHSRHQWCQFYQIFCIVSKYCSMRNVQQSWLKLFVWCGQRFDQLRPCHNSILQISQITQTRLSFFSGQSVLKKFEARKALSFPVRKQQEASKADFLAR